MKYFSRPESSSIFIPFKVLIANLGPVVKLKISPNLPALYRIVYLRKPALFTIRYSVPKTSSSYSFIFTVPSMVTVYQPSFFK